MRDLAKRAMLLFFCLGVLGCQTGPGGGSGGGTSGGGGGGVTGNEGGTAPINQKEATEYQKAILKCYKTGGSRIVKIENTLRCF